LHEKFPEITMNDLADIWCEHKESKPKICQHTIIYVKGKNANTQFTVKVKGEGNYCSFLNIFPLLAIRMHYTIAFYKLMCWQLRQ
jgi:hypothetical protein